MSGQISRRNSSAQFPIGAIPASEAGLPVRAERRRHRFALRATSAITTAAVASSQLFSSMAYALPQGGVVVEGEASISYGTDSVVISQGSANVIIEWSSFDVAANETVHFDQAAFMAALNRVLSGEASVILGSLTGAGSITLVNAAGIAFGATASVDVGAITATTLDILNANFMANQLTFDQYDEAFASASVTNAGTITVADQGLAALVAPGVSNSGLIQARTGAVVLASGTAFTVDFYGDGLINFAVTGATQAAPVDADGNPLPALVSNSGQIYADGGTVILAAEAVGGIVNNAINMDGVVQARTVEGRNGQVALVAGEGAGQVLVAGTVDASGAEAGTTGGTVHVLGDVVGLIAGADVNVSGAAGGGEALVGGAYAGADRTAGTAIQYSKSGSVTSIIADLGFNAGGYVPSASITYVDAGAAVSADATYAGDGGAVAVWANADMQFYGVISAQGGANGGNGGFAELSTGGLGVVDGVVLMGAAQGLGGSLLLDPLHACVGTSFANCSGISSGQLITPTTIANFFAGGGGLFTVSTNVAGSQTSADIVIGSDLNLAPTASNAQLDFLAHDDITVESGDPITVTGANGLHIRMIAGAFETGSPGPGNANSITINANISTNGGNFTAIADDDISIGSNVTVATKGGSVWIEGLGDNGNSLFSMGNNSRITTLGSDGPVTILAQDVNIGGYIFAGTNVVTIGRSTVGTIDVGDNNGSSFRIDQGELTRIFAGELVIGNANTTNVTVDNAEIYAQFNQVDDQLPPPSQGCENSNPGSNPNCSVFFRINDADLTLRATVFVDIIDQGLTMGTGTVTVDAPRLDLNARVFAREQLGNPLPPRFLLGDARLIGSELLTLINVLSQNALIQQALDFADSSARETIDVDPGTYDEAVVVNKSVDLLGNNAGTAGYGARAAESRVTGASPAFTVNVDGVLIDGFTMDGPGLTYGVLLNDVKGTIIRNNIIRNSSIAGIGGSVDHDLGIGTLLVERNKIDDTNTGDGIRIIGDPDFGNLIAGVSIDILNNEIGTDGPGGNTTDDGVGGHGIVLANIAGNDATINISGNEVHAVGDGVRALAGIVGNADLTLGAGNDINAGGTAINIANLQSPSTLTISGGSYTGVDGALLVDNTTVNISNQGHVVIENAPTFTAIAAGARVASFLTDAEGPGILLDLTASGASFIGGATGLYAKGPGFDLAEGGTMPADFNGVPYVGTLGSSIFQNNATFAVELGNDAEWEDGQPNLLWAGDAFFDIEPGAGVTLVSAPDFIGPTGAVTNLATFLAVENALFHYVDAPQRGLFWFGQNTAVAVGSLQLAVNIAGKLNLATVDAVLGGGTFAGVYGGSVEVWVDNLKINGNGAVMNLALVDPYANNGPANQGYGFLVADVGAVGDGSASALGSVAQATGGPNVTGVVIDPFTFTGAGNGVVLGAAGSIATNASVLGNTFTNVTHGIVARNIAGTTTLNDNRITALDHGIWFDTALDGDRVEIHRNHILANNNTNAVGAGIFFGFAIDDSVINIGSGNFSGPPSNIITARGNAGAGGDAALDGIHFAGVNGGGADITIDNNWIGFVPDGPDADNDPDNRRVADDGIEFNAAVYGDIWIIDNHIRADGDGVRFDGTVGDFADIVIGRDSDGNHIDANENGVRFNAAVTASAEIEIGRNTVRASLDGIRFASIVNNALEAPDSSDREIWIHHNNVTATGNGVNFQGAISNARHDTRIEANDMTVGGDGVRFGSTVTDAEIWILNNNAGFDAGRDAVNFEGAVTNAHVVIRGNILTAREDGVGFDAAVTGSHIEIDDNDIDAGHDQGDRGIEFNAGVTNSTVTITKNVIVDTWDDGILFNGVGIAGASAVTIADNDIGTSGNPVGQNPDETNGGAGIDVQALTGTSWLKIIGNDIFAKQVGIQFDGAVTTTSTAIASGYSPGGFGLAIVGNHNIVGQQLHGIQFIGAVDGPPSQTVNILIADNNAGIWAGAHGITFDNIVDNLNLHIHGNNIDAGQVDGVGDGIHFGAAVTDSWIKIDDHSGSHHINALGDGIDFDALVARSTVIIDDNKIRAGSQAGERGIEFDAGLNDVDLYVTENDIRSGDDGMIINGVGVSNHSHVEITKNDIGSAGNPVGQTPDEVGAGIDIQTVTDTSSVLINRNDIYARQVGIQFDGPITTTATYIGAPYSPFGFGIAIVDNHHIVGQLSHGIQFAGEVNGPPGQDVNILIANNNDGIWAGGHGITFDGIVDNLNLHIHGNNIDAGQVDFVGDGIHFGAAVTDSWIKIDDHSGLHYISALGDGIDFDALVADTTVIVDKNRITAGSQPGERGIEFDAGIDNVDLYVTRNRIRSGDDGMIINGVGISNRSHVEISWNEIGSWSNPVGQNPDEIGAGIDIQSIDRSFVKIDHNEIFGNDTGIQVDGDTTRSNVFIVDNKWIVGKHLDGIQFAGLVRNGANVTIADNWKILGLGRDGIQFNGIFDYDTDVKIDGNWRIFGHDNGIHLARAVGWDGSGGIEGEIEDLLALLFGEGWAIRDAEVRITGNHEIEGGHDNGILVEGVKDNGHGHDANLLIAGNHSIVGKDNGVWLAHGIDVGAEFDIDWDLQWCGFLPCALLLQLETGADVGLWAIDSAGVVIAGNHLISGLTDDGIRVDGVRDGDFPGEIDALVSGFDRTELVIADNKLIVGGDNGINLGYGFDLGIDADLSARLTGLGLIKDLIKVLNSPDPTTLDFVVALLPDFDLDSLSVSGSMLSIAGAEVKIADNLAIVGLTDNGILAHGVYDSASGGVETEASLALVGGPNPWNLDIVGNGGILGKLNGIHLAHGYTLDGTLVLGGPEVTSLSLFGGDFALFGGFSAWAISNANVRISDNWLIHGLFLDGIQVDGVHAGGVSTSRAGAPTGADDPLAGTVLTDPSQPNLLIELNTTVAGGRDGMHFGTGFEHDFWFGSTPTRFSLKTASLGGFGHFGQSVDGGLVVIDLNGRADYQAVPTGGGAGIGDPYDQTIPVVLSDLDFSDTLFLLGDIKGRVIGRHGDGIDFAGAIRHGSTVQIQRNMITGSGDNGIEFAQIGGQILLEEPEPTITGSEGFDTLDAFDDESLYGPTYVFVHNNFIHDNGRRVEATDEGGGDEELPPTETESLSLASFGGHHTLTGAGILFEQGIGTNATGEVFQNYITSNGGPGIQIGFAPSGEPTLAYIDPSLVVSAANLHVIHNYLPGTIDLFNGQQNGSFAIANYADTGIVNAPENWWGTIIAGDVAASFAGPVFFLPYLATGADSNTERFPGFTGLGPFAFQPGPIFTESASAASLAFLAQALLLFIAGQTDPDLAPGDQVAGRTDRDAANVFDSVFGSQYGYLDGDLANLAPAAGGGDCTLTEIPGGVRLSCTGGGLGALAPGAGPGATGGAGGGGAIDPGVSLQDLINMWLFNFGDPADTPVVQAPAGTPDQQAAIGAATGTILAQR